MTAAPSKRLRPICRTVRDSGGSRNEPFTHAPVQTVSAETAYRRVLEKAGLVEEVGRLETVGRPILYGVTDHFLQHFGLIEMTELPPLETADTDALWAATALADVEN